MILKKVEKEKFIIIFPFLARFKIAPHRLSGSNCPYYGFKITNFDLNLDKKMKINGKLFKRQEKNISKKKIYTQILFIN